MKNPTAFRRTALAAALLAAGLSSAPAHAGEKELQKQIDLLTQQLNTLRAEVSALKGQQAAAPAPTATPVAAAAPAAPAAPAQEPATVLGSYGEINANFPERGADSQIDIRRFVLSMQHRFDPKTKLVTELEVEHAVASADDAGEVEVEQAYFERELNSNIAIRGGLMLMPLGLLNENHEPTSYFGVERNFVETAIIPSTLREAGVQGVFTFGDGYTLQTGIVTGPNLSNWDATSTEGQETPLGSIHQEGQLAAAHDPSFFGALNWRGIPGLQIGAGAIGGNVSQKGPIPHSAYLLWDAHARYAPGHWQLSALYTRGSFSNTAEVNTAFIGNPALVPESFDGGLVEAAYKLWQHEDIKLWPFARWESFNTGRSYADLGPGLTPAAQPTQRVVTTGASLYFGDGLVVKADYQWFDNSLMSDRLNLGLGWSF